MAHEPFLHPRVEAGGGFVEEEHARPDEQFGADDTRLRWPPLN